MRTVEIVGVARKRLIAGFLLVAMLGAIANVAMASTEEWLGLDNNDSDWTSNGNWVGVGGARPNDDLLFRLYVPRFWTDSFSCPDFCTVSERRTNYNDFPVNTNFNSLTFSSARYVISGNQIFLTNGIKAFANETIFNPNIILGASQTFSGGGRIEFNGVVNLNGKTLTIKEGRQIFDGLITGSGNLVVTPLETVFGRIPVASVVNSSSVSFNTQINRGGLEVNGAVGQVSMQGGVLSGTGSTGPVFALVNNGGAVSPGSGSGVSGILRSTGNVSLFPGFTLAMDLNGTIVGSQHDQFRVINGNLVIDGVNLDLKLGFVPTAGQQFTVIEQIGSGAILGQFVQGQQVVKDNQLFAITYLQDRVILTCLGQSIP